MKGPLLVLAGLLLPISAFAQFGFGGPGNQSPQQQQPAAAAPPSQAATGFDDAQRLATQAPTLPANPLEIPDALKPTLLSNAQPALAPPASTDTRFYGLWYSEERASEQYQFRTLFPFYGERTLKSDTARFISPLYYQRRSERVDADVFFPLVWKTRVGPTESLVVGPFMHRESVGEPTSRLTSWKESPAGHDNWLLPLMFEGKYNDGSGYLHLPPLLWFASHTKDRGYRFAGPSYCLWEGGSTCDTNAATDIDMGLFPFYFFGRSESTEYELIPPLLHYSRYQEMGETTLNVWGPVLHKTSRDGGYFNVLPLFYRSWDAEGGDKFTVAPLFHYGTKGNSRILATPLFVDAVGDAGEHTFATYLYASHRGRTELDMWTPLVWQYRDPDISLTRTMVLPFFYKNDSERSSDLVVAPLFAHLDRKGIQTDLWLTPLFHHQRSLTGWQTDILPVFSIGRENFSTHLVAAPIIWDFASPRKRSTVIIPAYYRFADDESTTQVVLNTYFHENRRMPSADWQFHIFPVTSFGEEQGGWWFNVLYGLVGYQKTDTWSRMRLLYAPIPLSGTQP